MTVKAIPEGFSPVTPHLHVKGTAKAIEFYAKAFGAVEKMRMPMPHDPTVLMHAEIAINGARIMLADYSEQWGNKDPSTLGGTSVVIHLYVEDCDAAYKKAIAAGCTSTMEPDNMFWGDRFSGVVCPFGHRWSIATHISDPTPEEIAEKAKEAFGG